MLEAIVSIAFLIAGSLAIIYGRNLPPVAEEKRTEGWPEWLYGPPGYYRASIIFLGGLLVFFGVIALIAGAFASTE